MTHPFSDFVFDSAQLNPDESPNLINQPIQIFLQMSSDELNACPRPQEDVKDFRTPSSRPQSNDHTRHLISSASWSPRNSDEYNRTRPKNGLALQETLHSCICGPQKAETDLSIIFGGLSNFNHWGSVYSVISCNFQKKLRSPERSFLPSLANISMERVHMKVSDKEEHHGGHGPDWAS